MRKIELEMLRAMDSSHYTHWKKDNTEALTQRENGRKVSRVYLHGNKIAQVESEYPLRIYLTTAGRQTKATASRLHAVVSSRLPGDARVDLQGGKMILSLKRDGEWVKFDLGGRVTLLTISSDGVVTVS